MAGGEEEINTSGNESGDEFMFGPRKTKKQDRQATHKQARDAAAAAAAIATAQLQKAVVTERPMTAAELALEQRRYANSIQAATPALPDIYTRETIVDNTTTATADNLGSYLKTLRGSIHVEPFSKRNKSMQQLIRYNKTGAQVQTMSVHNRWRKEVNRIIVRIKKYLKEPRSIGNIFKTTTELLKEKCNDKCLIIEFNIGYADKMYEFHITFHDIYGSSDDTSRSGAFHIVYEEENTNGNKINHHIYRFVPYIDTNHPKTIKLKLTFGPAKNIIETLPLEVIRHIRNIAEIVQSVFTYTLNPRDRTPLWAALQGGSKRTVRRNRCKRRTATAKLLRR
jgi:hypothetical protein